MRRARQEGKIAAFSIAVQRSVREESGDWRDEVDFFDCSAWNGNAQKLLRKGRKGDHVVVHGKLAQNRWTTEAGDNRSRVSIICQQIEGEFVFRPARFNELIETELASAVAKSKTQTQTATPKRRRSTAKAA